MNQLDGLLEFCAVVKHGGFTRAAAAMEVSPSFVSRRVGDLERRLGVRLLHRTTRRVNLTDLGAQYHERATAILAEIETLETDLAEQQTRVKGSLRVSAGGLFGETWVARALAEFAAVHPEIDMSFELTDRRVDLAREGFDLAIRHGTPSDPDLVVRRLRSRRIITCAAPSYLEDQGAPTHPQDLARHRCLVSSSAAWLYQSGGAPYEVKVSGRWSSNNGPALVIAAEQGLGVLRLADTYLRSSLAAGRLVALLEAHELPPQETVIVYPSRDRLPHRVRALIDHLVQHA